MKKRESNAAIIHEMTILAPPRTVYAAITTQKGLASWWTTDVVAKPKVGSIDFPQTFLNKSF